MGANNELRTAICTCIDLRAVVVAVCDSAFVLADGPVNTTLEDASVWFAMTETPAQAYARAHAVWRQWLKHWHLTGDPRALRTALVCGQIAEEKLAAWQAGCAAVAPPPGATGGLRRRCERWRGALGFHIKTRPPATRQRSGGWRNW